MANTMGCDRGDRLSAIAPVSGGLVNLFGPCVGKVAAWVTHGSMDDVVDPKQGESVRNNWVKTADCQATTMPADLEPCVAEDGCGRDVHWCLHDGGHEWPKYAPDAIWKFFSAQSCAPSDALHPPPSASSSSSALMRA